MPNCPVCLLADQQLMSHGQITMVKCERCGSFNATRELIDDLPYEDNSKPGTRLKLSQYIRRSCRPSNAASLPFTTYDIEIARNQHVPATADEQADDLLLFLADQTGDIGKQLSFQLEGAQSLVRAASPENVMYLVIGLRDEGLLGNISTILDSATSRPIQFAQITFKGWRRIRSLRSENRNSKTAFIAMKFGNSELEQFLTDHIRPSVQQTGFRLQRLDDEPKAGLIDARLRLEIQSCRFLLADLTDANNGAYWEAGYAEGLGKPVIYLCKASVFNDEKKRPHFDTNHHLTIIWDIEQPDDFKKRLKACIRYSIPEAQTADSISYQDANQVATSGLFLLTI